MSAFYTIGFDELIKKHQLIIGDCLSKVDPIEDDLNLLQRLRNNETHFAIHQGSFLHEQEFCSLYNFMIRFYKILDWWRPTDKEKHEFWLLPYWGDPDGAYSVYGFDREPMSDFTYRNAVNSSLLAHEIAELLSGNWLYGAPDFSPYSITKELIEVNPEYTHQFDDIWSIVHMMQIFGMIKIDERFDDELGKVHFVVNASIEGG